MKKLISLCFMSVILSFCSSTDIKIEPKKDISNNGHYAVDGDAAGHYDLSKALVFGFSQSNPHEEDVQVYEFCPDVNMRAWQRWNIYGLNESDFNKSYISKCRDKKILFVAGGTASAVFRDEAPDNKTFSEWVTRDAKGKAVTHDEIVPNAYRASMASSSYRKYLVSVMKVQIDAGVDGLFFDEADSGGKNGGKVWNYNGNEGYEDCAIADFNRYLMNKYPDYSKADWIKKFGMTEDNVIRRDIAYDDLNFNFNYRKYLAEKKLDSNPRSRSNPLAAEWGFPVGNRMYADDKSYTSVYTQLYWKEIVRDLRAYAREKYSKEILITSNGIFPCTDFNSIGLYNYNIDDKGKEADYVPVISGRLNGSKSLMPVFLELHAQSRKTSGYVPAVLFIDWPTKMINDYYALSVEQKKDYYRIFAAEAYACGLYFAFTLKTVFADDPTAEESGILDFLKSYSAFYRNHADVYLKNDNTGRRVTVSKDGVSANLTKSRDSAVQHIHLINHNYSGGIREQKDVSVSFERSGPVRSVRALSPDTQNEENLDFDYNGKILTIRVPSLLYYRVLVIQ